MSNPNDKRTQERFPIGANAVCVFSSPVLDDFGPVKVKNISLNGIGFISTDELHEQLRLAITLVNSVTKFSKTLLVRVIHVSAQPNGTYLIGGLLETPLTYEELCKFVL